MSQIAFHTQAAGKAAIAKADEKLVSLKTQIATVNRTIAKIENSAPDGFPMNMASPIKKAHTPILDAFVSIYQENPNASAEDVLSAVGHRLPAAAAPSNSAPQASAAAIASAILDETDRRAAAARLKTRSQFDALTPSEKSAFFRAGGKLIDDPAPPAKKSTTPGTKTRAEFDAMDHGARNTYMRSGGKLTE